MQTDNLKIALIGAGNLATQLGIALWKKGFSIVQVYSRTTISAMSLAERLQTRYTTSVSEITPNADIYIFAVKDDALPQLLAEISPNEGFWLHTAGSVPMAVFEGHTQHYGVFYPLQTFSKSRAVDFEHIPVFIEASNNPDEMLLQEFAQALSNRVTILSSEKREYLHLSAVFACNFTNHMYALATDILEEQGLDWNLLLPLIKETADKITEISPKEAQTGPAVRYDKNVINKQAELLNDDKNKQELYKRVSESIHKNQ